MNIRKYKNHIYLGIIVIFLLLSIGVILRWSYDRKHAALYDTDEISSTADTSGHLINHQIARTETTIDSEIIEDGLTNMGMLLTAKYYFKEASTMEKATSLFGKQLGFTETRAIFTYEGYVPAGINFETIKVTVNDNDKSVHVKLPQAEILDVFIDPESFQILDEKENVFNKFKIEEFNDALKDLEAKARKSAIERDLLEDANKNAELIIQNFVSGITAGTGYSIEIER